MKRQNLKNTKSNKRKAQTMTEYIILVCLVGAGCVLFAKEFGGVLRAQITSAASEIGGVASDGEKAKINTSVQRMRGKIKRGMNDFYSDN